MAKDTTTKEATLTLPLDAQTLRQLAGLARRSGRSVEDLATDALREHAKRADPSLGTDAPVPPPKGG